MRLSELPKKLQPYVFHGVEIHDADNGNTPADCFVCGEQYNLSINTQTGQYRCFECGEEGNIYTFLRLFHKLACDQFDAAPILDTIDVLCQQKNLQPEYLRQLGVVPNPITEELIVPGRGPRGEINTLYKIVLEGDQWSCYSTPTCKAHPFIFPHPEWEDTPAAERSHYLEGTDSCYVIEGPWDTILWKQVIDYLGNETPILGISGASNFPDDWLPLLPEKVISLFDNDYPRRNKSNAIYQPGWDGTVSLKTKMLGCPENRTKKYMALRWGEKEYHTHDLKDGYDISDLVVDQIDHDNISLTDSYEKAFEFVASRLKGITVAKVEKKEEPSARPSYLERTTFDSLCQDYVDGGYFFPQNMKNSLAVGLAIALSTEFDGDQLFGRLIGPPGCGKTTIAEALSFCQEHTFPVSIQTGFHSGYTDPGGDKEDDHGLIPKILNKMVIIKDGDTLITAPNKAKILAEIRDIWDGASRAHYRSGKSNVYEDIKATFLICGTDDLRKLNLSSRGDRFLDCEVLGKSEHEPFVQKATRNTRQRVIDNIMRLRNNGESGHSEDKSPSITIKRATAGYLKYLKDNLLRLPVPEMPDSVLTEIESLASFLCYCRARINKDEDQQYKPRVELPTRAASQLTKMAFFLAYVLNRPYIDDLVMLVIKKLTTDTAHSIELEIIQLLYYGMIDNRPYSARQIAETLRVSDTFVTRKLDAMRVFKMIQRGSVGNHSGAGGRNGHVWGLTPDFAKLCQLAL